MSDERRGIGRRPRIALGAALVAGIACLVVGLVEFVSASGSAWLAVLMFVLAASAGWRVTVYLRLLRRSR
jgi:hypothetical protein